MRRVTSYSFLFAFIAACLYICGPNRLRAEAPSPAAGDPDAVSEGTRFLVALNNKISTGDDKVGKTFTATTLEPLITSNGLVLQPGALVRGHVSRVEPAQVVGRGKIWLTFDDIRTPEGQLPLVAEVSDVPGEASVKAGEEGQIEVRTSAGTQEAQAAAAGAAMGAIAGAKAGGKKGAATGAGVGAMTAFLVSSGFGQEIQLQKETKLELILYRPLYVPAR